MLLFHLVCALGMMIMALRWIHHYLHRHLASMTLLEKWLLNCNNRARRRFLDAHLVLHGQIAKPCSEREKFPFNRCLNVTLFSQRTFRHALRPHPHFRNLPLFLCTRSASRHHLNSTSNLESRWRHRPHQHVLHRPLPSRLHPQHCLLFNFSQFSFGRLLFYPRLRFSSDVSCTRLALVGPVVGLLLIT